MSRAALKAFAIGAATFAAPVLFAGMTAYLSAPWGCYGGGEGEAVCEVLTAAVLYLIGGFWTVVSAAVALVVSHKVYRRAISHSKMQQISN
jgi:hypothetical protein